MSAALEADIRRIVAIWHDARARFGKGGPFLFGTFTNADAMYAPVATRFRTYGVDLSRFGDDGTAPAYAEAILALPEMAEWTEGAAEEVKARALRRGSAGAMVNTFLTPVPHHYSRETGNHRRLGAPGKDWLSHGNTRSQGRRPRRRLALALLATTAGAAARRLRPDRAALRASVADEPKLSGHRRDRRHRPMVGRLRPEPARSELALGYAAALKNIGSRDRALEVLTAAYQANHTNGEIAAELGRLALDMDRLDIAQQTLKVAEAQGVKDWKTLSAQGTLRAKQGRYAEAQQYYPRRAASEARRRVGDQQSRARPTRSTARPNKAEELLRKAVASGTRG